MDEDIKKVRDVTLLCIFIGIFITFVIWAMFAVHARYSVWSSQKAGEAELARAQSNRQIKTLEAKANEESAYHLAAAEVVRAEGVAQANKIIGDSLKENEAYLRYRWIEGLQTNQMQVIYVPTEGNLPILEAGRLKECQ